MIVSKVTLTPFHLTPITAPSAALKSASMPMIVVPLAAMNSSGGYVASMAAETCPAFLILAGTKAATAASFGGVGIATAG